MTKAAILVITTIENNQLHYEVEQSVRSSFNSYSDEISFKCETIYDRIYATYLVLLNNDSEVSYQ